MKTLLAIMLVGCVSNAPDDIDSSQASPSNAGSSSNGATTPPTQPPCRHYHIEEIPPLVAGETTTAARALCSSGAVVGAASLSSSSSHAVVYKADQVTDLGTLGGDYSRADDGNAQGTIVGLAQIASGLSRAFVYRDGAMTELAGIGGSYAEAFAINDGDEIAGTGNIPANGGGSDTNSHALLWEPGDSDPIDLTVLNGGNYSFARDINAAGDVVGTDIPLDSHTGRAVVWHDRAIVYLDSGVALQSGASAINDAGAIAGYIELPETNHAVIWRDGTMIDLGPSSQAGGIANNGDVVGSTLVPGNARASAFLYTNGSMVDLNTVIDEPGWWLDGALDVCDNGRIVGDGAHDGISRGFVLTPVP